MQTKIIQDTLAALEIGPISSFESVSIAPLLASPGHGQDAGPEYLCLSEALAGGALTVTEVSQGGSVPEISVVNNSDSLVLILDGEELIGAKQNRAANATLLLAPHSKTLIPVSCTERGRWSYGADEAGAPAPMFLRSENVMAREVRSRKAQSVSASLRYSRSYSSSEAQSEVWGGIAAMIDDADADAPTDAMKDVYMAQDERLSVASSALSPQADQVGSVFFVNGRVAGCEVVSRRAIYAQLHEKLIRSYVIDAPERSGEAPAVDSGAAAAFLAQLGASEGQGYPSVGLGEDVRLAGSSLVGSALIYEEVLIHCAAFVAQARAEADSEAEAAPAVRLAGFHSRRANRGQSVGRV